MPETLVLTSEQRSWLDAIRLARRRLAHLEDLVREDSVVVEWTIEARQGDDESIQLTWWPRSVSEQQRAATEFFVKNTMPRPPAPGLES